MIAPLRTTIGLNAFASGERQLSTSMERLSSGLRINRGSDDAGGLSMSETMRSRIRGMQVAMGNVQDGIRFIQIAEDGIGEIVNVVQRMRELLVQANNGTLSANDQAAIDTEFRTLGASLIDANRVAAEANLNFAGGSFTVVLQVGAEKTDTLTLNYTSLATNLQALFLGATAPSGNPLNTVKTSSPSTSLPLLDLYLKGILKANADLGAAHNRLEHILSDLGNRTEQVASAESRVRDTDMAQEMTNLVRSQLQQRSAMEVIHTDQMRAAALTRLLAFPPAA